MKDDIIKLDTDPEASIWVANADQRSVPFKMPPRFEFSPQPDITAHEVALVLAEMNLQFSRWSVDDFPECVRRHMKEI